MAASGLTMVPLPIPPSFNGYGEPSEAIEIYLAMHGPGASVIPFRVMASDTIASVKTRIQSSKGFFARQQRLVYDGRELSRENTLIKDYGVSDGEVLHLVLRLSDLQEVTIRTCKGDEHVFRLDRTKTVADLKRRISCTKKKKDDGISSFSYGYGDVDNYGDGDLHADGLAVEEQMLVLRGTRLSNETLIEDLALNDDSAVIHLFARRPARIQFEPVGINFNLSIHVDPRRETLKVEEEKQLWQQKQLESIDADFNLSVDVNFDLPDNVDACKQTLTRNEEDEKERQLWQQRRLESVNANFDLSINDVLRRENLVLEEEGEEWLSQHKWLESVGDELDVSIDACHGYSHKEALTQQKEEKEQQWPQKWLKSINGDADPSIHAHHANSCRETLILEQQWRKKRMESMGRNANLSVNAHRASSHNQTLKLEEEQWRKKWLESMNGNANFSAKSRRANSRSKPLKLEEQQWRKMCTDRLLLLPPSGNIRIEILRSENGFISTNNKQKPAAEREIPYLIRNLVREVQAGLENRHYPILSSEGSGGAYFMRGKSGKDIVAVFKPIDEEPLAINNPRGLPTSTDGEGLKKGTRVGEGAFREVAAYLLDHPAKENTLKKGTLNEGFSGVPPTVMIKCPNVAAFRQMENGQNTPVKEKVGSVQMFVHAISNCEDMGPARFPIHEVHKISVLDIRLANTDRNGGNILVLEKGDTGAIQLIPIDHGYCLPTKFEDCTFEWLYWPQARVPYQASTLDYIASLDAEKDIATLREYGWDVPYECAHVLRVSTMLLKKAATAGLTPFEIGSIMCRESLNDKSVIERMLDEAACSDSLFWPNDDGDNEEAFMEALSRVMDMHLLQGKN